MRGKGLLQIPNSNPTKSIYTPRSKCARERFHVTYIYVNIFAAQVAAQATCLAAFTRRYNLPDTYLESWSQARNKAKGNTRNMASNQQLQRSASSMGTREREREKTYFEQQREALIGEIAMVRWASLVHPHPPFLFV